MSKVEVVQEEDEEESTTSGDLKVTPPKATSPYEARLATPTVGQSHIYMPSCCVIGLHSVYHPNNYSDSTAIVTIAVDEIELQSLSTNPRLSWCQEFGGKSY